MEAIDFDYLEKEFIELDCIQSSLEHLFENVKIKGADKNSILVLESLSEESFNEDFPVDSFTTKPSEINKGIALEGILAGIITGLKKAIQFIFRLIAAFFDKLTQLFRWLGGKGNKSSATEEAETKQDVVIKAIQTNAPTVKIKRLTFDNTINNKVVKGITTERLLMFCYDDNRGGQYRNLKEIMEEFFKKDLNDVSWQEIVNNRDSTIVHLINYVREWWNSMHPIVANPSNTTNSFVKEMTDAVDFVIDRLSFRMRWWIAELTDLIKFDKASLTEEIDKLDIRHALGYKEINDSIIEKVNGGLVLLPFVKTRVNDEITISLRNAFEEFKVARITPKSKIDFVKSLNKIEWVRDIDYLSKNVNRGKAELAITEKQVNGIINEIKGSIISSNREMTQAVNRFFREMRCENQKLTTIAFSILSFLINTERLVSLNRKKGAALHELLIALGLVIEKDLTE